MGVAVVELWRGYVGHAADFGLAPNRGAPDAASPRLDSCYEGGGKSRYLKRPDCAASSSTAATETHRSDAPLPGHSAEGLPVLAVYLASSVRMRESHQANMPLIHLDPRHKLTQQFVELHNLLENA